MKAIDNKYKIGQKVWIPAKIGTDNEIKPGEVTITNMTTDEMLFGLTGLTSSPLYPTWTLYAWDIFPTEAEAQSRCDELNNKEA